MATAVGALPAQAHAQLLETDPADGSELPALPEVVVLSYNEEIAPQYVDAALLPPEGEPLPVDTSATNGQVSADLAAAAPPAIPGDWRLVVRVVSVDGHPVESSVGLTVTAAGSAEAGAASAQPTPSPASAGPPAPGTSPAPDTSSTAGSTSHTTPEETTTALATDTVGTADNGPGAGLAVAAVLAAGLAIAVAGGLLVARSRRRRATGAEAPESTP